MKPDPAVEPHARVRIELPASLCLLANVSREIEVEIAGPVTQRAVLDAVEVKCPQLLGTIRDQKTKRRRPFIRFFACEEDLSHASPDELLPEEVANGRQALLIIGAIAGG
jgi:hypothetical protein